MITGKIKTARKQNKTFNKQISEYRKLIRNPYNLQKQILDLVLDPEKAEMRKKKRERDIQDEINKKKNVKVKSDNFDIENIVMREETRNLLRRISVAHKPLSFSSSKTFNKS